ncbi:hypothetical protein NQZ68_003282 [Dissostichus eleginoides]|nr:hypothetical protein NQZ68_003282 [Dissostichus eleginoides]
MSPHLDHVSNFLSQHLLCPHPTEPQADLTVHRYCYEEEEDSGVVRCVEPQTGTPTVRHEVRENGNQLTVLLTSALTGMETLGENRFTLVPYRRFVSVNGGVFFLFDRADCQGEVTTAEQPGSAAERKPFPALGKREGRKEGIERRELQTYIGTAWRSEVKRYLLWHYSKHIYKHKGQFLLKADVPLPLLVRSFLLWRDRKLNCGPYDPSLFLSS